MKTKVIINPQAGRGRGARALPQIHNILKNLNIAFDSVKTGEPRQAIALAQQAARDGYARIVAVGGDGTCNEVVNGLFAAAEQGHPAVMGIIPVGSGNDFAYALGIPPEVEDACRVLKHGSEKLVDLIRVTVDGQPRLCSNGTGIGFDGEVVADLQKGRYLHGFLMYLWSVLRVLMFGRWPYKMTLRFNNARINQEITLITVANGTRAGGGFLLTPNAKLDDGLMDICYANALSKAGVLNLLPRTFNGSHIHQKTITMATTPSIAITVEKGAPAHIDGEVLCTAGREFVFELLPRRLSVWV